MMSRILLCLLRLVSLSAYAQTTVVVNPDGTHSIAINNGTTSTIVNPDGTHTVVLNNGNNATTVNPKWGKKRAPKAKVKKKKN